jgi:NAD(P)-dependent dehydrogenase (short-subunit alcohol dehydrogenase family)
MSGKPELAGQTVVVIGGSAGIGLETARRARAEGADLILRARAHPGQRHRRRLRRHTVVRDDPRR